MNFSAAGGATRAVFSTGTGRTAHHPAGGAHAHARRAQRAAPRALAGARAHRPQHQLERKTTGALGSDVSPYLHQIYHQPARKCFTILHGKIYNAAPLVA